VAEADSLRIALLTYRGNPHSGGQGVYVRYLSKALADLGHSVEVISGQPHPELDSGIASTKLESLDLYRSDDPFRTPRRAEFRDAIDVAEFGIMCVAGFPEPLTFSLRAMRELKARRSEFDVVHDNQSLGYGLLGIARAGLPVTATIHHPCSIDRDIEVAHAVDRKKRMSFRRWYAFTRMQGRVARRLGSVITVSESARTDVMREFRVPSERIAIVHNGVDTELFAAGDTPKEPGLIITTASADVPLKGLPVLLEALAKIRTERDARLVVVGKPARKGPTKTAIERFGLQDAVSFEHNIDWARLVELYARAEVAVVPSLYEGFSLPAIEAMSCAVPLVVTTAGALPEVTGPDGEAALLVPPGDAEALAAALRRCLEDPQLRLRLGRAGRRRAIERFTWRAAAAATADVYREAIERC
jgi:glycosyltransferase involved in cell wall biosynthesis